MRKTWQKEYREAEFGEVMNPKSNKDQNRYSLAVNRWRPVLRVQALAIYYERSCWHFLDRKLVFRPPPPKQLDQKHQSNEYIEVANVCTIYHRMSSIVYSSVVQEDAIAHIKKAFIVWIEFILPLKVTIRTDDTIVQMTSFHKTNNINSINI